MHTYSKINSFHIDVVADWEKRIGAGNGESRKGRGAGRGERGRRGEGRGGENLAGTMMVPDHVLKRMSNSTL